tara:strand:- start:10793 stop:12049 length:1257 start_codon:yes stop_codon:yes gene_type:complete
MEIIIFQSGEPLHIDDESRSMRAINLANKFVEQGHKVLIISAKFDHYQKKHRNFSGLIKIKNNLEIRLLNSPGYKKNIGIGRLIDHLVLSLDLLLKLIFKKIPTPDICIIGFPPIETSFLLVNWFKKKETITLLDVKDLWPEIFASRFPKRYKKIINFFSYPYKILTVQTIRNTNIMMSMSKNFLEWSQSYAHRKNKKNDFVFPLVSPLISLSREEYKENKQWWEEKDIKFDKPTFCFIGTLSIAYQFGELANAVKLLEQNNVKCQFIICGKGTNEEKIKKYFLGTKNVFFPGWIDAKKAYILRENSIASIAPYKNTEDFMNSIPNKIIDSISYSLPVITSLKGIVKQLINDYQFGIYTKNNTNNWYLAFQKIIESDALQKKFSKNAFSLLKSKFDYEKIFNELIFKIENLSNYGDTI